MRFPIIEFVDRLVIATIKHERTKENLEELLFYKSQINNLDLIHIATELEQLKNIHNKIWDLEAELKSGNESQLPLEELGKRAIAIRDWNNKRIQLKNIMAEKMGCPIREIKKDHLSQ